MKNTLCFSVETRNWLTYTSLGLGFGLLLLTGRSWPFFVGTVAMFSLNIIWGMLRKSAFRAFAQNANLSFTGSTLPSSLDLRSTQVAEKPYSISNCLIGQSMGRDITIFDLSFRRGKTTIGQTIVAFRVPVVSGRIGIYEFEKAGEWSVGFVPKRLVEPAELDSWCEELHDLADRMTNQVRGSDDGEVSLYRMYREF